MDNPGQILFYGFVALCVLPIVLTFLVAAWVLWFGKKQIDRLVSVDPTRIQARYAQLHEAQPMAARELILKRIIHEQAMRSGLVGAVTGLGGFITLPIALPIDLVVSAQIQAALLNGIAAEYQAQNRPQATWFSTMLLAGSDKVSASAAALFLRLLVRIGGKSVSKFVPILGAITAFVVNYWITRSTGLVAIQWYARQSKLTTL